MKGSLLKSISCQKEVYKIGRAFLRLINMTFTSFNLKKGGMSLYKGENLTLNQVNKINYLDLSINKTLAKEKARPIKSMGHLSERAFYACDSRLQICAKIK